MSKIISYNYPSRINEIKKKIKTIIDEVNREINKQTQTYNDRKRAIKNIGLKNMHVMYWDYPGEIGRAQDVINSCTTNANLTQLFSEIDNLKITFQNLTSVCDKIIKQENDYLKVITDHIVSLGLKSRITAYITNNFRDDNLFTNQPIEKIKYEDYAYPSRISSIKEKIKTIIDEVNEEINIQNRIYNDRKRAIEKIDMNYITTDQDYKNEIRTALITIQSCTTNANLTRLFTEIDNLKTAFQNLTSLCNEKIQQERNFIAELNNHKLSFGLQGLIKKNITDDENSVKNEKRIKAGLEPIYKYPPATNIYQETALEQPIRQVTDFKSVSTPTGGKKRQTRRRKQTRTRKHTRRRKQSRRCKQTRQRIYVKK